jgi:hypothetical protein
LVTFGSFAFVLPRRILKIAVGASVERVVRGAGMLALTNPRRNKPVPTVRPSNERRSTEGSEASAVDDRASRSLPTSFDAG